MAKRKASKTLQVPIFPISLTFVIGREEADRLNLGMEDRFSGMVHYDYAESSLHLVLEENYLNVNTMVHETVHAAYRVLDMCGVKVSPDNHEPLAYMAGWIAQQLNEFVRQWESGE